MKKQKQANTQSAGRNDAARTTNRHTAEHTETDTDSNRDGQTDRQTDTQTDRHRQTDRAYNLSLSLIAGRSMDWPCC